MTLLDTLFDKCDGLFLQRIDAVAGVSIFSTPIRVENGATTRLRVPGTTGLTFSVNSDELGLDKLIVPGFDVLFTGEAVPGAGGAADRVIWSAGIHSSKPPGTVNYVLSNTNSLAIEIESVGGFVTTSLSAVQAPAALDDPRRSGDPGAILLQGPGDGDRLEIGTSYGTVFVGINAIQLVAVEQFHPVPAPTFTVKLKPAAKGSGGEFKIAGMAVPFNMKLVGAEDEWTCNVQLQGTPGLVNVSLTVTKADGQPPGPPRISG